MKKTLFILSLIFTPTAVFAADAPAQCTTNNIGAVQCMAQRMCECKFFRKSEMAGTPDHFGWDCGILRPNCLDYSGASATAPAAPYNGPNSVGYSTSNTSMTQSPVTTNTQAPITTNTQSPNLTQQQQSPTTTATQNPTQTQTQAPIQTLTPSQTNNQNSTQTNH